MKKILRGLAIAAPLVFSACETIPKDALQMKGPTLEVRKIQSRKFESKDEKKVLMACGSLLQDLGFNITESDVNSGLVVGQKDRSAVEAGQVVAKILIAGLGGNLAIDKNQRMKASIVTRPLDSRSISVRVTFQRLVWDEMNQLTRAEALNDEKQYRDFFEKLSKALFLDAQTLE
jgi:hypothetical protein